MAVTVFSGFISLLNHQPLDRVAEDVKPLAYFLILPFFAQTIRDARDVEMVARILKISALVLAICYVAVLAVWHGGLLTFEQVQGALNPAGDPKQEFYFRGETTFFFKASLYVGVGVFFFLFERGAGNKWIAAFLMLALLLTMTRGLIMAVFLTLAVWALFFARNRLVGWALGAGALLLAILSGLGLNAVSPSAAESNTIRLADLQEIVGMWDVKTLLLGQGLGGTIAGREHIEITYVEILYKQGILGLAFWLLPLVYLTWRLRRIVDMDRRARAIPYYLSALFVYFESATNPFLTNPIGMSAVIIAMVSVRALAMSSHGQAPASTGMSTVGTPVRT